MRSTKILEIAGRNLLAAIAFATIYNASSTSYAQDVATVSDEACSGYGVPAPCLVISGEALRLIALQYEAERRKREAVEREVRALRSLAVEPVYVDRYQAAPFTHYIYSGAVGAVVGVLVVVLIVTR